MPCPHIIFPACTVSFPHCTFRLHSVHEIGDFVSTFCAHSVPFPAAAEKRYTVLKFEVRLSSGVWYEGWTSRQIIKGVVAA